MIRLEDKLNDPYHVVMIFRRRKDNPEQSKGTQCLFQDCARRSQIVARREVYNTLALALNARVYVSVNARDTESARRRLMHNLIDAQTSSAQDLIGRTIGALMECPSPEHKHFMIDIDTKAPDVLAKVQSSFSGFLIDTPHGHHLIVPAQDMRALMGIPDVEMQRDGMTYLSWLTSL